MLWRIHRFAGWKGGRKRATPCLLLFFDKGGSRGTDLTIGGGASFRRLQFCAPTSHARNHASGRSLEKVVEMTEA